MGHDPMVPMKPLTPAGEIPDTGVPPEIAVGMTIAEQYEWHQAYLRRHRVSRRTFLRGSAAAAAVAALGVSPFGHRAYPRTPRWPWPTAVSGTAPTPPANCDRRAGDHEIPAAPRFSLDHGPTFALVASAVAEVRNLVTQVPASGGGVLAAEQFYVHVPLDDLPARMPHFYRWRTDDGFTGDILPATTAMANARNALSPFRFTMMGDQGTDDTRCCRPALPPASTTTAITRPTTILRPRTPPTCSTKSWRRGPTSTCWPATSPTPTRPDWASRQPSWRRLPIPPSGFDKFNPFVWDVYLGSIEASASTTPWMFATGNHDMEAAYPTHGYGGHLARLDFPRNVPTACPSVYSFVYGNVAVLSLDANDVSYEIKTNTGYSGGAQNTWVARTLAAHRANPDIDFIVCFFHHCAYSTTAAHASDGGVRAAWCDLFDRHQVDLVLQGHNHVFERTGPIRANRPTTAAADNAVVYPESDGTVYYTVGCAGRPRYAFQPGDGESYRGNELADTFVPNSYVWTAQGDKHEEAVGWSRVRFANYAFIRVDVRPGTLMSEMDVVAVDEYGREFDKLTYRRPVRA